MDIFGKTIYEKNVWKYKNKIIMYLINHNPNYNYFLFREYLKGITDLKIMDCCFDELDNLPEHIKILRLCKNVIRIKNLPLNLKKLYLYNNKNYIYVDINTIKLPFGCEIILL